MDDETRGLLNIVESSTNPCPPIFRYGAPVYRPTRRERVSLWFKDLRRRVAERIYPEMRDWYDGW